MEKASFGQRLKTAFGNAKYAQIAEKMGVSEATIKVYMAGRVPDADKLQKIATLTKCNLHWLLTGEGDVLFTAWGGKADESSRIQNKLAEIAKEQAPVVFADAEVAANLEGRTFDLLTEYLLDEALIDHNLTTRPLMAAADRKRAMRFSFVASRERSIEEVFRGIVIDELQKLAAPGEDSVEIEDAEQVTVRHFGTVDGGEEEGKEKDVRAPKRKTG